jgi:glycosyltransferase involved in cell wall biosynthesis
MPSSPVVSVVIPCLNQARYLRAALDSVTRQSMSSIETIVVDDGSIDDTAAVAAAAGAIVVRQTNQGLSAARNRGLRLANAPFVVFLDADDELASDALESGVAALERRPDAWMVGRCCVLVDADGHLLPTNCLPPESDDLYDEWLVRNLVWTPGAAMFRREPLVESGGFPLQLGAAADYAVYLEFARAGRVIFDARDAVLYRQHDSNMSRDAPRMLRSTLAVLRRERSHLPRRYRRQFRRGMRAWRTFYGEQIIQQLRHDARAGQFGTQQWSAVRLLVIECGGLVLTHLVRKLRRVMGGHPPADVEPGRFAPSTSKPQAQPEHTPAEAGR